MPDPKAVAEHYYDRLQAGDLDDLAAVLDPACVAHVPGATLTGPDAIRGWMQSFFDAFPDIAHERGALDVDGGSVSTEVTVRGTHSAPLVTPDGAIPATGRSLDLAARNEMEIDGGTIQRLRISFDEADFAQQLGLA